MLIHLARNGMESIRPAQLAKRRAMSPVAVLASSQVSPGSMRRFHRPARYPAFRLHRRCPRIRWRRRTAILPVAGAIASFGPVQLSVTIAAAKINRFKGVVAPSEGSR